MRIAIVGGTGTLGFGLAVRLAAAGHDIVIGSRTLERAQQGAERVRAGVPDGHVTGMENAQAAQAAEVIILAVPPEAQGATLGHIGPHVGDKVVVDTTVSLDSEDPTRARAHPEGSSAQHARAALPAGTRLVAAFHTLSGRMLAELDRRIGADALLCGDDPAAKEVVAGLASSMGIRPVDVGGLERAAVLETLTALSIGLNRRYHRRHVGVRFTGLAAGPGA